MKKRLFDTGYYDNSPRTFLINQAVQDIESSLIMCGATPEQDYTYRDLFNWAITLVTAKEQQSED